MVRPRSFFKQGLDGMAVGSLGIVAVRGKQKANVSPHRAARTRRHQPPKEKCDAKDRANEPNPPRVVPPDSDAVPDDEPLDEESPPKKLLRRDHDPPHPP
jgi:hypothetical protein